MSSQDNPIGGGENSHAHYQKAYGDTPLSGAIKTFIEKYKATNKDNDKKHAEIILWNQRTVRWITIYTLVTVAILCVSIRTFKETQDEFRSLNRPFVFLKDIRYDAVYDPPTTIWGWRVVAIIENGGATPTAAFDGFIKIVVGGNRAQTTPLWERLHPLSQIPPAPPDPEGFFKSTDGAPWHVITSLGPHSETPIEAGAVSPTESVPPIGSQYLIGVAHYGDALDSGNGHETKFCYIIDSPGVQHKGDKPIHRLCGHWNCTDGECVRDKQRYIEDQIDAYGPDWNHGKSQ